MGELRSLDDLLENPNGLTEADLKRIEDERVLGATAVLLHQQGHAEAAGFLADAAALELDCWGEDSGEELYNVVIYV
ncbi:hypothetical protein [Kitasatospora sp. NPDC017646]|uniref:hypothetical protein n=1 Tax=Kitasatospora sp. NPDC017646 TaxID=3364024 RepID=UPI00379DF5DD